MAITIFPFTDFEANTRIVLDLDPGKQGVYGQIFLYHPGMDYQEVIADSFQEFSEGILQRLQTGKFSFVDAIIEFDDLYI